ncbi:2OG-Fe(II) oxygenase [Novosphingobium sp. G106]|uniref:2OG-Fe(II) oxygenase n=1 Tax=Novosphingobium sp. G106 TaxID=2849500 RepID=UPI001C2CF6E8|nr:2OG-Fe(II) oxygenase [Novosphingobium sp. G106]MBV1686566.1 2OG-Fe(II) oxygenase [Novosphingobium sp. G106]
MTQPIDMRVDALDADALSRDLDHRGWTRVPGLLTAAECEDTVALYDERALFRSHVVMQRHGFGSGEYRYFAYPLMPRIAALRSAGYRLLAPLANCWHERIGLHTRFPAEHAAFLARCHADGQRRPTPLLLRYGPGDYNSLHQDLYGEHVFPLQMAVLLSQPGEDFTGGEFVLTEQRPRMQSRAEVVRLERGDAVIFAVGDRPQAGTRGDYRVKLRHGVSTLHSGRRHAMGIIFHDAP